MNLIQIFFYVGLLLSNLISRLCLHCRCSVEHKPDIHALGVTVSILTCINATFADAGTYTCVAPDNGGTGGNASAVLLVVGELTT